MSKPKQTQLSFFTKRSWPVPSSSESHHATVESDYSNVQPSADSETTTSTVDVDEHGAADEVEDAHVVPDENKDAHVVPDEDQDAALSLSPTLCLLAVDNVVKCAGFIPHLSGDIYHNFPCQLLPEILGMVFENNGLHHNDCLKNEYMLQEWSLTSNKCCTNLVYCTALKSIISRANKNYREVQTLNNKYLTFHQLENKSSVFQIAKREAQLEVLIVTIRNCKLTGTLNRYTEQVHWTCINDF